MLMWLLLPPLVCASQVGVGTITPNSKSILDLSSNNKGLLIPRMTGSEKSDMNLTSSDKGMMIFQTDTPAPPLPPTSAGLYWFDGTDWVAPLQNGTLNGQTLRWDGNGWVYTSNLFNQGSSIGIGTQAPKSQLHIHSNSAPKTYVQLTNSATGALSTDGLVVGLELSTKHAQVMQQENKPLVLGTNGIEQMRIDSLGRVGIGRANPQAMLDVNGAIRIGALGSIISSIMKESVQVDIPVMEEGGEGMVNIPCPGAIEEASVYISPGSTMSGLMIGYARVSAPGNVEVKFMNMGPGMEAPMPMMLHISVIQ